MVFDVLDYSGTRDVLSEATWLTKAGNGTPGNHPEIREYLPQIRLAIQSPDLVFESTRDSRSHAFYLLECGRDEYVGKHLVVIVKYVEEPSGVCGYISTIYLTRSVHAKGRLLWQKMAKIDD